MAYKDKEKAKEYKKRYYAEHREEARRASRRYYKNNKEKISKQHTQYMRNYYENNKEVVYACNKRWADRENEATKKYASTKRTMWTVEEEATLFELLEEGLTYTEIAIALGRSRESVQSKIGRVHRKQRMESINELQDLIELYHINSNLGGD